MGDINRDHKQFLDYSQELGLNVMPGYYVEPSKIRGQCPEFDCFSKWKRATLEGFKHGYRKGDSWHPAVALAILLDEADGFGSLPECQPQGAWCRVKAAISAFDGVLAAEREAGVDAGRVKFTVTWSFATRQSIDAQMNGPGIYGFQDMVAVVKNPQITKYTPRTPLVEIQKAFRTRWVHGLNTKSPWNFVRDIISKDYRQFRPVPWFVGAYGASGQDEESIQADLESMQAHTVEDPAFVGVAFLQFQANYWKGGAMMDYGMFGLGERKIGETGKVCQPGYGCRQWPVHCLSTNLSWLEGSKAHRAQAVATAWGGSVESASLCSNARRLEDGVVGTRMSCRIRADAIIDGPGSVSAALQTEDFRNRIASRTSALLDGGDALHGELSISGAAAWTLADPTQDGNSQNRDLPSWTVWAAVCGVAVLLLVSGLLVLSRRKRVSDGNRRADHVV